MASKIKEIANFTKVEALLYSIITNKSIIEVIRSFRQKLHCIEGTSPELSILKWITNMFEAISSNNRIDLSAEVLRLERKGITIDELLDLLSQAFSYLRTHCGEENQVEENESELNKIEEYEILLMNTVQETARLRKRMNESLDLAIPGVANMFMQRDIGDGANELRTIVSDFISLFYGHLISNDCSDSKGQLINLISSGLPLFNMNIETLERWGRHEQTLLTLNPTRSVRFNPRLIIEWLLRTTEFMKHFVSSQSQLSSLKSNQKVSTFRDFETDKLSISIYLLVEDLQINQIKLKEANTETVSTTVYFFSDTGTLEQGSEVSGLPSKIILKEVRISRIDDYSLTFGRLLEKIGHGMSQIRSSFSLHNQVHIPFKHLNSMASLIGGDHIDVSDEFDSGYFCFKSLTFPQYHNFRNGNLHIFFIKTGERCDSINSFGLVVESLNCTMEDLLDLIVHKISNYISGIKSKQLVKKLLCYGNSKVKWDLTLSHYFENAAKNTSIQDGCKLAVSFHLGLDSKFGIVYTPSQIIVENKPIQIRPSISDYIRSTSTELKEKIPECGFKIETLFPEIMIVDFSNVSSKAFALQYPFTLTPSTFGLERVSENDDEFDKDDDSEISKYTYSIKEIWLNRKKRDISESHQMQVVTYLEDEEKFTIVGDSNQQSNLDANAIDQLLDERRVQCVVYHKDMFREDNDDDSL